jgi:hypothetical protein
MIRIIQRVLVSIVLLEACLFVLPVAQAASLDQIAILRWYQGNTAFEPIYIGDFLTGIAFDGVIFG